jgi:hypothetical protein
VGSRIHNVQCPTECCAPMSVSAPPMQNPTAPTFGEPVALRYAAASHISAAW